MSDCDFVFRKTHPPYDDVGALIQYLFLLITDVLNEASEVSLKCYSDMESYEDQDIPFDRVVNSTTHCELLCLDKIQRAKQLLAQVQNFIKHENLAKYHVPRIYFENSSCDTDDVSDIYYKIIKKLWKKAIKLRRSCSLTMDQECVSDDEDEKDFLDKEKCVSDDEESYVPEEESDEEKSYVPEEESDEEKSYVPEEESEEAETESSKSYSE